MNRDELIFVVRESPDGGYEAHALDPSTLIKAPTVEELREKVRERVRAQFASDAAPAVIRLRTVQDEVLLVQGAPTASSRGTEPWPELSKEGKKLALNYFNHVETQVGLAATTAYLVLVADTILVNAYVNVFKDSALTAKWAKICAVSAGLLLIIAMGLALVAVIPHMREKSGTVFYFGWIARKKELEYVSEFRTHDTGKTLHDELLKQISGKCQHVHSMFRKTKWAIRCTILGTAVMMILFVVIEFTSPDKRSDSLKPSPSAGISIHR